jgi:hypothetical protein
VLAGALRLLGRGVPVDVDIPVPPPPDRPPPPKPDYEARKQVRREIAELRYQLNLIDHTLTRRKAEE